MTEPATTDKGWREVADQEPTTGAVLAAILEKVSAIETHLNTLSVRAGRNEEQIAAVSRELATKATKVAPASPPKASITFAVYAVTRYLKLHRAGWRRNSRETVLSMFEHHIYPRWGSVAISAIDAVAVSAWLAELAQTKGSSVVRKCGTYLRAVLKQAVDEDLLPKDPLRSVVYPRQPRRPRPTVGLEAIAAVASELEQEQDKLIWALAVYCGFRPGELFALRWNDFDGATLRVDEARVRGRSEEPKTRASCAAVAVPASVAARLEIWRAANSGAENDWMFMNAMGKPIDTRNWQRRVLQPALKRAGLSHVTFQMLRRTWATLAHQAGASAKTVQTQLRHSRSSTTSDVYIQSIPADVVQAVENLANLVKMS